MDETDVAICRMLLGNSRTSYSEMSKTLGISAQAAHKRVQSLMEDGHIKSFTCNPSFHGSGMMWVMVHGFSHHPSMDLLGESLSSNPSLAMMLFASGNYVYIHAAVRDANEMANVVSYLQRQASISEMQVGIIPVEGTPSQNRLDRMDIKMIEMLSHDSRLSVSELSDSLNSSPKTIRRRLQRLLDEDLAHFSIQWCPDGMGDVVCNIHLTLRDDAPSRDVVFSLLRSRWESITRIYSFSNIPNLLIVTLWTKTTRELWELCREWESQSLFHSVVPNIIRGIHYFPDPRRRVLND